MPFGIGQRAKASFGPASLPSECSEGLADRTKWRSFQNKRDPAAPRVDRGFILRDSGRLGDQGLGNSFLKMPGFKMEPESFHLLLSKRPKPAVHRESRAQQPQHSARVPPKRAPAASGARRMLRAFVGSMNSFALWYRPKGQSLFRPGIPSL